MKTDYHVNDRVTVSDTQSSHYSRNGVVVRVHNLNGEIFYDVVMPHRGGIGSDSYLLRENQLV